MSVLLLSGGVDSLVLLAQEVAEGRQPLCVSFTYGQRHVREMNAASRLATHYKVRRMRIDLPHELFKGSALTGDGRIPQDAHFTDPQQSATVVPCRNMIFLAAAASLAMRHGHTEVLLAVHSGDHAIYPDCRPEFITATDAALRLAYGVGVRAPFLDKTKREIVRLGMGLGAPLDDTLSCYVGLEEPCGRCGACIERQEAFAE